MQTLPYSPEAYDLLHKGAVVLAEIESNGMAVDDDYIAGAAKTARKTVKGITRRLLETDVAKVWKATFGDEMNLNSSDQLGKVLFEKMGFKPLRLTGTGQYSTDEEALRAVDHPFVTDFLRVKKIQKAVNTNLAGLSREVVNGKVHCFFNLHTTMTFRSSSDSFNFQNIPNRDPEIGAMIRRAFVARKGRQIVEIDISGAEVRVAACYHLDPRMIKYLVDNFDLHAELATQLFKLPAAEVSKMIRFHAKNSFTFAEFYGDWYIDCASNLWKAVMDPNVRTKVGEITLHKHMKRVGLGELGDLNPEETPRAGTFEEHVRAIERDFWERRFRVYNQWKKDWFEQYRKQGWFQTLTGFICQGWMKRNEVLNYPVQGSSFHCLLWSLIEINGILKARKMKTLLVGQIHDSIVADVVPSEMDDFLAICNKVMTRRLPKAWPWLIVPMVIEAEAAPVGGSWADKKGVEFAA